MSVSHIISEIFSVK